MYHSEEEELKGFRRTNGGHPDRGRVTQSYTLVGQGTEVTFEAQVVGRKIQALLNTGVSIYMFRLKEFTVTNKESEFSDLRIVQATGWDIKISGMIYLPLMVEKMVTMQWLYVALALCRSMI